MMCFDNIDRDIGRSLFADDGALWKRVKNIKHIVKKTAECYRESGTVVLEMGF